MMLTVRPNGIQFKSDTLVSTSSSLFTDVNEVAPFRLPIGNVILLCYVGRKNWYLELGWHCGVFSDRAELMFSRNERLGSCE